MSSSVYLLNGSVGLNLGRPAIIEIPRGLQELPSPLLDLAVSIVPMPIDRNIQLLKEQIALFEAIKNDFDSATTAKGQQIVVLAERARVLQQCVRQNGDAGVRQGLSLHRGC